MRKSRLAAAILQARAMIEKTEEEGKAERRKPGKTPSRKSALRKNGETELRKTGKQKTGKTELRKTGRREMIRWADTANLVTVGTKAPEDVAVHWAVEAKRRRVSMAYVIGKALIEAFGVPEGALLENEERDRA